MVRATSILNDLGKAIAAHRQALGLSQADVARRSGLTRASISNIEGGRQDVPVSRLVLIAQAVGLTPSRLLDAAQFVDSEVDAMDRLLQENAQLRRRMNAALKALNSTP